MKFPAEILLIAFIVTGCARFQPQSIDPVKTAASFEARDLGDAKLRDFLELNLHQQFAQWPSATWDFEMLNLAALYYHPSLDVARAQWAVVTGGDKTAAQRPNPTASVVPGYDISAANGMSPWLPAVTFDLPLETMGKRGYRIAEARHMSEAARLNIASTAWKLRSDLRSALADLIFARAKAGLLQKQIDRQEKIAKSLEQQVEAGAIARADLGAGQLALAQGRIDLIEARQLEVDALARVADGIGVSIKALQKVGIHYEFASEEKELTSVEARQDGLTGRADILGALAEFAARQSALQLEIAKQYPDIHLGPGYQFDQGDHKFSLSITAELPLFNQNQGPIAEAKARRAEAVARFEALQARVIGEIDRALESYRLAQENMKALATLEDSQKKRREALEGQLQAGAVTQSEVLNVQIELGASELAQLNGRMKLEQSLAALENALQRPIAAMQPALIEQSQRVPVKKENNP